MKPKSDVGIGAHTTASPSATKKSVLRFEESGVTSSSGAVSGDLDLKSSTSSAINPNPRTNSIATLT